MTPEEINKRNKDLEESLERLMPNLRAMYFYLTDEQIKRGIRRSLNMI